MTDRPIESPEPVAAVVARYRSFLRVVARGRRDCGRPLSGAKTQELARRFLVQDGLGWGAAEPVDGLDAPVAEARRGVAKIQGGGPG